MDDKCFYDNYKYHPMEAQPGNGLYYNRDTLVNNYTAVGKPQCAKLKTQTHQSVITPGHLQTKQIELTKESTNKVKHGHVCPSEFPNERYNYDDCHFKNTKKCLQWNSFNKCRTEASIPQSAHSLLKYKYDIAGNIPNHYNFTGDMYDHNKKYNSNYPCQRLFNNSTKRSTLPNFHNTFDVNPKYLC